MTVTGSDGPLTRSGRVRVLRRAAMAWRGGRPHVAWQLIHDAGMAAYWPEFQRAALAIARQRFKREITRYTA